MFNIYFLWDPAKINIFEFSCSQRHQIHCTIKSIQPTAPGSTLQLYENANSILHTTAMNSTIFWAAQSATVVMLLPLKSLLAGTRTHINDDLIRAETRRAAASPAYSAAHAHSSNTHTHTHSTGITFSSDPLLPQSLKCTQLHNYAMHTSFSPLRRVHICWLWVCVCV